MSAPKVPATPLAKIALSCSGGGYRAATFHLGAMAYLHHLQFQGKPLLENVTMISTVSGGTITGAIYALHKQKGDSFEDIYKLLVDKIAHLDLVKMGIQLLNPGVVWENGHKRKNLINAFAEIYDREFTHGESFQVFDEMKSHLEAVVFNSTEFDNGVNFRFRDTGSGLFGNKFISIPKEVAAEVKLADAIASSSCFPGGFEPLVWPGDFAHKGAGKLQSLSKSGSSVGIMDGGIYDNQGIQSILMYKKGNVNPYFDLVIVSDVASPYMEGYKPTADREKKGLRSLNLKQLLQKAKAVNTWITLILVALIAGFALLPMAWGYSNNIYTGLCLGAGAVMLMAFVAKVVMVGKIRALPRMLLDGLRKKIPDADFYQEKFAHLSLETLSLRRLEPLLLDRLNSLITLLSNVFLKVVRRLNYDALYTDNNYLYRRISNLIKELTEHDYNLKHKGKALATHSVLQGTYPEVVGEKIAKVATTASGFGTTLWFTEDQQLNDMLKQLLATGMFNMCYNMIDYLETLMFTQGNGYAELPEATRQDIEAVYRQAVADWNKFREDPFFLANHYRQ